jgi:hypothetical protein
MNNTACKKEHRYFHIFSDLPIAQSGAGRHKCAGCAYEKVRYRSPAEIGH